MSDGPVMPIGPGAEVTVVVPVRNDPENLARCLDAIGRSSRAASVVVVDDASTDADAAANVAASAGAAVLRLAERAGPAVARNRGAEHATTPLLFFVDADVLIHPDAVERVSRSLSVSSDVDAVFGCYDAQPGRANFCSQYKNLFHRYVHRHASEEASTFWSGCGAIRRDVFFAHSGFSATYERPCIEDIELGMRMKRAGRRILVDKDLQGTHLKKWTMLGLIRSDVFDRAIPWARLIVAQGSAPNDLNVGRTQRLSAMLACLAVVALCVAAIFRPVLLLLPAVTLGAVAVADAWSDRTASLKTCVPVVASAMGLSSVVVLVLGHFWSLPFVAAVAAVVLLNADFYAHWVRLRGIAFAALVVPMHLLYFNYSAGCLALVTLVHALGLGAPARAPAPSAEVGAR